MCGSKVRRWIIGLLLLGAVVAVAAGYLLSEKPTERADKGTLVRAVDRMTEEKLREEIRLVGDCL